MIASNKTLVHVYLDKSFGFGDYLRGSICMAQQAKRYNFNLKLDVSGHPIHHYMAKVEQFNPVNVQKLFNCIDSVETMAYLLNKFQTSTETTLYVASNFFYELPLSQEVKDFVNSSLEFKEEYYYKTAVSLPLPAYSVLHVRCSDDNIINMDELMKSIDELSLESDTLLLSSSYDLKKDLQKKRGYSVVDDKPVHCAFSDDVTGLESVVTDYIILSKSKKTTCISFYGHGSGFSEQCSVLHNVPYHMITQEPPPFVSLHDVVKPPVLNQHRNVAYVNKNITGQQPDPNTFKANTVYRLFNAPMNLQKKMPSLNKTHPRRSFAMFQ